MRAISPIVLLASALSLVGCGGTDDTLEPGPKTGRHVPGPIERALEDPPSAPAPEPGGATAAADPSPGAERAPEARRADEVVASPREALPVAAVAAPERAPAVSSPSVTVERIAVNPNASPVDAPQAPASELTFTRAVIAAAIEAREPSGTVVRADAERAFLFLEVQNDAEAPAALEVEWEGPDGVTPPPTRLSVPPSPRWRTWANTSRIHGRPGAWTVRVRAGDAVVVERRFEVAPGADPSGPELT